MLQLYFAPGACSFVPHVGLEAAKAQFEPKLVKLHRGEHRTPEYLAMNPSAQVPVLVRVRLCRARQLRARQPVLARRLQRRAVGAPAHWAVLVQRPVPAEPLPAEPLPEGRVLALLVAAVPVDLLLSRQSCSAAMASTTPYPAPT